jgi:hypothetical protein
MKQAASSVGTSTSCCSGAPIASVLVPMDVAAADDNVESAMLDSTRPLQLHSSESESTSVSLCASKPTSYSTRLALRLKEEDPHGMWWFYCNLYVLIDEFSCVTL